MEKQKLIEKLKEYGAWCTECHDIHGEKDRYVKVAKVRELLERLDEHQKVKVPAFVAEQIEQSKKERQSLYEAMWNIESSTYYHKYDNATYQWMFEGALHDEHQELFAEAYMHGYEVEEEQKFEVIFPNLTGEKDLYLMKFYEKLSITSDRNFYIDQRYIFTEKEIKSIDERYWPFAVPVEKVEVREWKKISRLSS